MIRRFNNYIERKDMDTKYFLEERFKNKYNKIDSRIIMRLAIICLRKKRNLRLTTGIRSAACSAAPGFRSARSFRCAPFPRLPPATFWQPWPCSASPYPGCQNVAYLKRYATVWQAWNKKIYRIVVFCNLPDFSNYYKINFIGLWIWSKFLPCPIT
jgi:hypothetical protein